MEMENTPKYAATKFKSIARALFTADGLGQHTGMVTLGWIGLGRDFLFLVGWVVAPK